LWYEGWTSAYTVEAILIQLQSFLFEVPSKKKVAAAKVKVASDDASIAERDIYRDAVDEANSFKCT
jgi:ubiquitin-protein ligase